MVETNMADPVNSPPHYKVGPAEAIDVIAASVKDVDSYCHGNALKYLIRAQHKGKFHEDIAKAQWYLNRILEGGDADTD